MRECVVGQGRGAMCVCVCADLPRPGYPPPPPLTTPRDDETTWPARTWLSFVSQRLSVATQLAAAQEVAEALGLSVAADPRLQ